MLRSSITGLPPITSKVTSNLGPQEIKDHQSFLFGNDFAESLNKYEAGDDFTALLTCHRILGSWECVLSKFKGNGVEKILGDFARELTVPLDLLIPHEKREIHQRMLSSILNEGSNSRYWNSLFNNMLKDRYIQIINLSDSSFSNVKIFMELKSYSLDQYEFIIKFNDNSLSYDTAHRAGMLTHNFRSIFRAILNQQEDMARCVSKISEHHHLKDNDPLVKRLEIALQNLNELATEGLTICRPTFKNLIENDEHSVSNMNVDFIDDVIRMYLPQLKLMFQGLSTQDVDFLFEPNASSVLLELAKITLLKDFIQNLIKNSITAHATEIRVVTNCEDNNFVCRIIDNGDGMSPEKRDIFFKRDLKKQSTPANGLIEASRGEGTLLAYHGWHQAGGEADVDSIEHLQSGTVFKLSIPPVIPVLFRKDQRIFNKKTDTTNKPTLLLIDDSWVQIKLILRKIFPDLVSDASALFNGSWNNNDFLVLENEQWHIICAAGYLRSLQCAKEFSVDIIISDHQLGHSFYDGGSLLKRIYDTFQNRPILCLHTSMKDCSPDQLDFFDTLKSIGANFFIKGEPETLSQILNFLEDFLVKRNENQILKKEASLKK